MKIVYFLSFLVIFIIALLFSLLNLDPVKLYFYKGLYIELPLALLLTLELLAGVIIGLSVRFFRVFRLKSDCAKVQKKLYQAEAELQSMRTDLQQSPD